MRRLIAAITLAFLACLISIPALASGAWTKDPTDATKTCTPGGTGVCYWRFTAAGDDSSYFPVNAGSTICLDPDIASSGGTATVYIRMAISSQSANGSFNLEGALLNGTPPLACIYNVPAARVAIDVQTGPSAVTAAVCVAGPDARCGD